MNPSRPSISRILWVDYGAFIGAITPLATIAVGLLLLFTQPDGLTFAPWLMLAGVVIGGAVLLWRYRLISSVFEEGEAVSGAITNVSFFRDRGRVEYVYTYQGQKLVSGNAVHRVRQSEALTQGQTVTVLVDRSNPKRAFVRELYL